MPWAEARVGRERLAGAYAWRRFLQANVRLALGSDFPVESADPRLGLYAAVTRQDLDGEPPGGWLPDQKLTPAEALHGFTVDAAWASFMENEVGRLAPGLRADFVLLDADPLSVAADRLPNIRVLSTWLDGAAIYTSAAARTDATVQDASQTSIAAREALERYVEQLAAQQDPRVAEALARIDDTGRRLLALRSYLRSHDRLAERWSWTQEQIHAYEGSPEHHDLLAEIDRVREAFARDNPGFELWVNPQVRSLDRQLASWNTNESVGAAANRLATDALEFVGRADFPAAQAERARHALESFLLAYQPVPTPTVAAPGLSPHGQMRAVDFQVHQGDRIIAGPRTATVATEWDATGWASKLDAAVRAASRRFIGPLATPREPWHYTYAPESVAAQ
jgi:hypothetical protein